MTEWLTENRRRAYPLIGRLPDTYDVRWSSLILDASVACDLEYDDSRVLKLISLWNSGNGAVAVKIGISDADALSVRFDFTGDTSGRTVTAYAESEHVKAYVTLDGDTLRSLCAEPASVSAMGVNIPLVARCTSYANRFVESIECHSPENGCDRPVFGPDTEHAVMTAKGDVRIVAGNGIDADVTGLAPVTGELMRVTAVTAPLEAGAVNRPVDMMIRGDDCIAVETMPGRGFLPDGTPVELPDSGEQSGGIIRLTEKCKPCCQCEDYENAANALRPGEKATFSVKDMLDRANEEYRDAVKLLDEINELAKARINDYDHVPVSAVSVASGGTTPGVSAPGTRWRISVNLTVTNFTMESTEISEIRFTVPGYTPLRVNWGKSGHENAAGVAIDGMTWVLDPGDTLSVVATYAMPATTSNLAVKPAGMNVTLTRKITSKAADTRSFDIQ